MITRELPLCEDADMGEAYCLESEVRKLNNITNHYRTLANDTISTAKTPHHIDYSAAVKLLERIVLKLQIISAQQTPTEKHYSIDTSMEDI